MRSIFDTLPSQWGGSAGGIAAPAISAPIHQVETLDHADIIAKSGLTFGQAQVPKSWFVDPNQMLNSMGLGYQPNPTTLTFETLRAMSESYAIISSIIQLRTHQVAQFAQPQPNKYSIGFKIKHKGKDRRLTDGELNQIAEWEQFFMRCGQDRNPDRPRLKPFLKMIIKDRLTFDQICVEKVNSWSRRPTEFYHVPGSTIRIATPKHRKGTPLRRRELGLTPKYVQIFDNVVFNDFTTEELIFSIANPRTDIKSYGYGTSELELLARQVTSHLWAEDWNRKVFSQGSTTKGLLNMKGNLSPNQLEAFKRQWMTQVAGITNAWKTPVLNTDGVEWINLQQTNQEMGYSQWIDYLTRIACAVYLVDPAEINFDSRGGSGGAPMFMSTNEAQQKVSQDRGLRPLLSQSQDILNDIMESIDDDYEFVFVGLDAKTEEQAIELRLKEQSVRTMNEIREMEQLPPVPHGDIVCNPAYLGYRSQKEMMEAQQQAGATGQGQPPPGQAPGGAPDAQGQGQTPQLPTPDTLKPGSAEKRAREDIGHELGEPREKGKVIRLADRLAPRPEEWEESINASVRDSRLQKSYGVSTRDLDSLETELKKALEPLNDFI